MDMDLLRLWRDSRRPKAVLRPVSAIPPEFLELSVSVCQAAMPASNSRGRCYFRQCRKRVKPGSSWCSVHPGGVKTWVERRSDE